MYALVKFEGTSELFVTPSRNIESTVERSILKYNGAKFGVYVCGFFKSREIAKKVQLDLEHQYSVVLSPIKDLHILKKNSPGTFKVKVSDHIMEKYALEEPIKGTISQSPSTDVSFLGQLSCDSSERVLNADSLLFKDKLLSAKRRLFSSLNHENSLRNGDHDSAVVSIHNSKNSVPFEGNVTDMYALVQFEGTGELFVSPSRNIEFTGVKPFLKYNGAKFSVYVCSYFESRETAKKVQLDLEGQNCAVHNSIKDLHKFKDICQRSGADKNTLEVKVAGPTIRKDTLAEPMKNFSQTSSTDVPSSKQSNCNSSDGLLNQVLLISEDELFSAKKRRSTSLNQRDTPENWLGNGDLDTTTTLHMESCENSKSFEGSVTAENSLRIGGLDITGGSIENSDNSRSFEGSIADMYVLVKFEGTDELFVTSSGNIEFTGVKSLLKYNGAKFSVYVCGYFESREMAKKVQLDLQGQNSVVHSPIKELHKLKDICQRNCADKGTSEVKVSEPTVNKCALPKPIQVTDRLLNGNSLIFKDKRFSAKKRLFSSFYQHETINGGHDTTDMNIDISEISDASEGTITEGTSGDRRTKWKSKKQHACFYCGILIKNITRHLEMLHYKEDRVRDALFAKRTASGTHRALFELLRKDGDENHNLKPGVNKKIMVRNSNNQYVQEVACPYCKGFFSKKNINRHVNSVCKGEKTEKFNNLQGTARIRAQAIEPVACDELVRHIYPYLTKESQRNVLIKDPTAISFGNLLIDKHFLTNLGGKHIHIAQQLRLLADIFNNCKAEAPELTEIKDMFHPKYYRTIINGIKKRAGYSYGMFDVPSAAISSCTLLCKVIEHLKSNAILSSDAMTEKLLTKIEYLITRNRNNTITKMAGENQTQRQRAKVEILPTTAEIKNLMNCLDIEFNEAYKEAKHNFNLRTYSRLCRAILANIMVFNRKRPGDCQKTLVIEYRNMSAIDREHLNKLCKQDKITAVTFSRFLAQGKLNKKASNLLFNSFKVAINFFLGRRHEIGVEKDNKYLFANPKGKRYPFFKADEALYTICRQYKLNYSKLTANKLRKHLATSTSLLPSQTQALISDFMGHSMGVHKNIYQQRQVQTEVITIAKVLQDCAGISNEAGGLGPSNVGCCSDTSLGLSSDNEEFSHLVNNNCRKTVSAISKDKASSVSINEDKLSLSTIMESDDDNVSTELTADVTEDKGKSDSQNDDFVHRPSRFRTYPRMLRPTKKTWSTPERQAVRRGFRDYINREIVPSVAEVDRLLIEKNMKLFRPPHVIRAWIAAAIKKQDALKRGHKVQGWTTPQRHRLRKCFRKYFDIVKHGGPRQYPPTYEVHIAIEKYPELREKKRPMILSKLQHEFGLIEKQLQKE